MDARIYQHCARVKQISHLRMSLEEQRGSPNQMTESCPVCNAHGITKGKCDGCEQVPSLCTCKTNIPEEEIFKDVRYMSSEFKLLFNK